MFGLCLPKCGPHDSDQFFRLERLIEVREQRIAQKIEQYLLEFSFIRLDHDRRIGFDLKIQLYPMPRRLLPLHDQGRVKQLPQRHALDVEFHLA
jgi:hypothetical protein